MKNEVKWWAMRFHDIAIIIIIIISSSFCLTLSPYASFKRMCWHICFNNLSMLVIFRPAPLRESTDVFKFNTEVRQSFQHLDNWTESHDFYVVFTDSIIESQG